MTRGDEIVPAVTHSTNDGPAVGLGTGDATLADYEARGGLELLRDLPSLERIVDELKASGLTGYGGAGFPTGLKWEAVSQEPGPRYVVVNADEGEPGTIKDRYVMELRPHLMVEATVLAMRSLEAPRGVHLPPRGVRDGSRSARSSAIEEFRAAGLLDGLSLELVVGAGAYIAGEETAMLESMEGRRAMPRLKPPFPSQFGYLGRPDADPERRDARAHPGDRAQRRRVVGRARDTRREGHASLVGDRARSASPAATRRRTASRRASSSTGYAGGFSDEVGAVVPGGAASGILPPAALDAPLTRDGLREYGAGAGLGCGAGLPGLVLAAPPPRRDDALLRRGVVPEVHAVPDRQPRAPPPRRGARARRGGDDAREGRRVAARDGEDVDLRARPGRAVPGAKRDDALARAVRAAGAGV